MFLQGLELFRLGSPELINLILTLQGVVYEWQKMLLFHVLSMGNRLIKCFPIRTISSSREKSQRWACIRSSEGIFCIREDYFCGILFRLRIHHDTGSAKGRREEDQNKSAEAYFVEVNLHLEYTVLAFVGYLWQRRADLEKKQPARLLLSCGATREQSAAPALWGEVLIQHCPCCWGSAFSSCVFFPFLSRPEGGWACAALSSLAVQRVRLIQRRMGCSFGSVQPKLSCHGNATKA